MGLMASFLESFIDELKMCIIFLFLGVISCGIRFLIAGAFLLLHSAAVSLYPLKNNVGIGLTPVGLPY